MTPRWTIDRHLVDGKPSCKPTYCSATHKIMHFANATYGKWRAYWLTAPAGAQMGAVFTFHRTLADAKRYADGQASGAITKGEAT